MNYRILFGFCTFILVLSFINSNTAEETNSQQDNFFSGFNKFLIDFYKTLGKSARGNIVSSGITAYMLLLVLACGTVGEPQKELLKTLNAPGEDDLYAWIKIRNYVAKIQNASNFELFFANAIYASSPYPINTEFDELYATVTGIDFGDINKVAKIVNSWSQKKTQNKISELIQPDDFQKANMVMATTAFFKGNWMHPFTEFQHIVYYFSKQKYMTLPMMCSSQVQYNYGVIPNVDAQYIEIPYQTNDLENGFSMYIILPNKIGRVYRIIQKLNNGNFTELESAKRDLVFCIPKFRIVKKLNLVPTLRKMGIHNVFDNLKNFTFAKPHDYFKTNTLVHKTVINVDANGTESDGATSLSLWLGPIDKPAIYVNRPFIAVIISKINGSPLFWARVKYPRPQPKTSSHPTVV